MPKIKTNRTPTPPEGFEEIEAILDDYSRKMRDGSFLSYSLLFFLQLLTCWFRWYWWWLAESESHEGKRKTEALWPIMRITHTRTRYIYDLYYKREAISKELYEWLCKQEYADAKWVFEFLFVVILLLVVLMLFCFVCT